MIIKLIIIIIIIVSLLLFVRRTKLAKAGVESNVKGQRTNYRPMLFDIIRLRCKGLIYGEMERW